MSFSRVQAAEALALGWTQAEVLRVHDLGDVVEEVYDWGAVVVPGYIAYKAGVAHKHPADGLAIAYTDGSGTTAKKSAGIGVYIEDGDKKTFIAENIGLGSNNVAELTAIWRALRAFPNLHKRILIRSDSEYAIGILTEPNWCAQANSELVRRIREDLRLRGANVQIEHVDGHSKIEGNEIADGLANIGRTRVKTVSVY